MKPEASSWRWGDCLTDSGGNTWSDVTYSDGHCSARILVYGYGPDEHGNCTIAASWAWNEERWEVMCRDAGRVVFGNILTTYAEAQSIDARSAVGTSEPGNP